MKTRKAEERNSYTMRIGEKPLFIIYEGEAEKGRPAIIVGRCLEIRVSRAEDYGDPLPDAAFIVRACNNFDKMLNALKQVQIIVDAQGGADRLGIAIAKVIEEAQQ